MPGLQKNLLCFETTESHASQRAWYTRQAYACKNNHLQTLGSRRLHLRQWGVRMWCSAAQLLPAVRAFAGCGERVRTNTRPNQSRTCRRTCSRLIWAGRFTNSFRCTSNPMVLQSRNLETSIIQYSPMATSQIIPCAHAADERLHEWSRCSSFQPLRCVSILTSLGNSLVFARNIEGSNDFPPHHFANV